MKKYIGKRLFWAIVALIGLSIFIFYFGRIIPGDPIRMMVSPQTPEHVVDELRQSLALDRPIYTQYLIWMRNVFQGDLGFSVYSRRSVTVDVQQYLPISLELITYAALVQIAGSFLLGIFAGSNIDKWQDHLTRLFSYIGVSVPAFVFAIIFLLVFSHNLGWFPSGGALSEGVSKPSRITGFIGLDALLQGQFFTIANFIYHATLPAVALAIPGMAQVARMIRSGMITINQKEYISMARGYGLPERVVRFKYLLRPSIIPGVTVLGMQIAMMLGNAFLVEMVFGWPGFSRFAINAMLRSDLNTIVATVLIIGIMFAIINIIVDTLVAYIDPRIRYSGS
ncbi:MAG: ABC transporter permease [Thermoplasmatota archaeon]